MCSVALRRMWKYGGALGLMLTACPAWSQEGAKTPAAAPSEKQAAPAGADRLRSLLQRLDANHDGMVEPTEVPAEARDSFDRLLARGDTNKDGKLDVGELRGLGQSMRGGAGGAGAAGAAAARGRARENGRPAGALGALPRFDDADRNKDGKLSADELEAHPGLFKRIDTDGNGEVTRDELLQAARQVREQRLKRLEAMDKDGDGSIARLEFTGQAAQFDRLDTDHNGSLTREEYARPAVGASKGLAKRGQERREAARARRQKAAEK